MDKEIVFDAVQLLCDSIKEQKEAMLLLEANGIVITDVSPMMKHVQVNSGIERLAAALDLNLGECSFKKENKAFYVQGIEWFEINKEVVERDLSTQ